MNFSRNYWIFIAAAVFFATVSSVSTLYLASVRHPFRECNSVAAACFGTFGMIPCMTAGILALIPVMIVIPYILKQNEHPGLISYLALGCFVIYTGLDAANNISVIFGYQNIYLFAHSVLSTANNATGTAVGTGESLC